MIDPVEHLGLAYKWGASYAKARGLDRDDCVGEAMLGLARAARSFDPSRGLRFSTYAVCCIERALSRLRAAAGRTTLSIDAAGPTGHSYAANHATDFLDPIDVDLLQRVRDAIGRCGYDDLRGGVLLIGLSRGWTYEQMADELGVSRERVRQLIVRLRIELGQERDIPRRHRPVKPQRVAMDFRRTMKRQKQLEPMSLCSSL